MTEHETARRAFATSLDFSLEPGEREMLDRHLDGCPSCRSFAASVRRDASVLRDVDFGPVPIAVRANLAIASEGNRAGGAVGRWMLLAAAGALLLATLGGVLGVGGRPAPGPNDPLPADFAGPMQVAWTTKVVDLRAREFSIVAGGKTFRAATPMVGLNSDPGNANYRTLEAAWTENGVEMRLNLYFGGDATSTWVNEIRIYNGAVNGEWLYAKGRFFEAPHGATWRGDADITMVDADHVGGSPAQVHFAGLSLLSRVFDGVNEPPAGGIVLPAGAEPFAAGGQLHCSGILQMAPRDAERTLLALSYKVSWRYVTQNGGYWDARKEAPDGVIPDFGINVGPSGELIIPVIKAGEKDAVPAPYPADCPPSGRETPPSAVQTASP
jgi:hypothetical protein